MEIRHLNGAPFELLFHSFLQKKHSLTRCFFTFHKTARDYIVYGRRSPKIRLSFALQQSTEFCHLQSQDGPF